MMSYHSYSSSDQENNAHHQVRSSCYGRSRRLLTIAFLASLNAGSCSAFTAIQSKRSLSRGVGSSSVFQMKSKKKTSSSSVTARQEWRRQRSLQQLLFSSLKNDDECDNKTNDDDKNDSSSSVLFFDNSESDRRNFFKQCASGAAALTSASTAPLSLFVKPEPANARGLIQFPCPNLLNTYHFMRAGKSLLEEDDIWMTNPLFLTNRDSAMTEEGEQQIIAACEYLKSYETSPTTARYSLAAHCLDTADIIKRELKLGTNIVLPEYTWLDPRGVGKWESLSYEQTSKAVWAMDNYEAGEYGDGPTTKPPLNDDGTPSETLYDQAIRFRQLLSLLETQYSGDIVLLVFPDNEGPALLSALIAGIPLNRCHELQFQPGELRLKQNYKSINALWKEKQITNKEYYDTMLAEGKVELQRLRSTKSEDLVSIRDQKLEEQRQLIEKQQRDREIQRNREAAEKLQQQKEQERLLKLQKEEERKRKELEAKQKRELAIQQKEQEKREKLAIKQQKEKEKADALNNGGSDSIESSTAIATLTDNANVENSKEGGGGLSPVIGIGAGVVALGGIVVAGGSGSEDDSSTSAVATPPPPSNKDPAAVDTKSNEKQKDDDDDKEKDTTINKKDPEEEIENEEDKAIAEKKEKIPVSSTNLRKAMMNNAKNQRIPQTSMGNVARKAPQINETKGKSPEGEDDEQSPIIPTINPPGAERPSPSNDNNSNNSANDDNNDNDETTTTTTSNTGSSTSYTETSSPTRTPNTPRSLFDDDIASSSSSSSSQPSPRSPTQPTGGLFADDILSQGPSPPIVPEDTYPGDGSDEWLLMLSDMMTEDDDDDDNDNINNMNNNDNNNNSIDDDDDDDDDNNNDYAFVFDDEDFFATASATPTNVNGDNGSQNQKNQTAYNL